jgi:predicted N-acetyltransferase YhbS
MNVLPEFQNKGIGKELIKRCIEHFQNSEWLVQTTEQISFHYEKNGFEVINDVFLPSRVNCFQTPNKHNMKKTNSIRVNLLNIC